MMIKRLCIMCNSILHADQNRLLARSLLETILCIALLYTVIRTLYTYHNNTTVRVSYNIILWALSCTHQGKRHILILSSIPPFIVPCWKSQDRVSCVSTSPHIPIQPARAHADKRRGSVNPATTTIGWSDLKYTHTSLLHTLYTFETRIWRRRWGYGIILLQSFIDWTRPHPTVILLTHPWAS